MKNLKESWKNMSQVISKFEGEYEFLSNFYSSKIIYDIDDGHIIYAPTVEHAFQATKTTNWLEEPDILTASTPGKAKRLGRKCELRKDWEEVKDNVMLDFVRKKFQIPELRDKLLATGDAELVEGNTWHDSTWGICVCPKCINNPLINGQNKLGHILMKVREEIREEQEYLKKIL